MRRSAAKGADRTGAPLALLTGAGVTPSDEAGRVELDAARPMAS